MKAIDIFEECLGEKSSKENNIEYVHNDEILKVNSGGRDRVHIILNPEEDLSCHLLEISKIIEITELKVAVRYLYMILVYI